MTTEPSDRTATVDDHGGDIAQATGDGAARSGPASSLPEPSAGDGLAEAISAFADLDALLAAARERAAPAPLVGCVLVRCRSHNCATTGNLWELPVTETPAVTAPGWAFCSLCAGVLEPLRAYTMAERPGVWAELYAGSAASAGEPVRCGAYL